MNKKILEQKEAVVTEIKDAIAAAKSVTVVEYRGLTVSKLEKLRKQLREQNCSFKVYKNTLFEIACPDFKDKLEGPNAFIFSNNDEVSAPKILCKFAKANEEMVIKTGLMDGKVLSVEEVTTVAKLPNKDGLISMFLSCLNSPIQKFAATVKAVADKGE